MQQIPGVLLRGTMAEAELNKLRRDKKNMVCADCPAKCDPMYGGFGAIVVPYKSFVW